MTHVVNTQVHFWKGIDALDHIETESGELGNGQYSPNKLGPRSIASGSVFRKGELVEVGSRVGYVPLPSLSLFYLCILHVPLVISIL